MTEDITNLAKGKIPERLKKQMDGYKTVLSKLMHSQKTREGTMEMLKSGPPEISVPMASLKINEQAEGLMESKGMKLTDEVKLYGSVFLVGDLVDLGNMGANWPEEVDEKETVSIYQDTLQDYIHKGFKDGTRDPIELQQAVEPLLPEKMRQQGRQIAQANGIPMEPTPQQILGNQRGMLDKGGRNGS